MTLQQKSILKKISVAVGILIGVYLLLLIMLTIYVTTNKEKIVSLIKETVNNNIQGEVNINGADISVWRSFPKIEVALKNVTIKDSLYHLPFLQMKEIDFRIGIFDVMGNETDIDRIKFNGGLIHIFKDSAGYSNAYVLKAKEKPINTKTKSNKSLLIDNIELENVTMLSENKKLQKHIEFQFYNLNAAIDKNDSILKINMDENCLVKGLGFDLSKGSFLNNQTVKASWELQYNIKDTSLSFNLTQIFFNNNPFYVSGNFFLNKFSPHFNLNVKINALPYEQAKQLLPQNVQKKLSLFSSSKPFSVIAFIGGSLLPKTNPLVKATFTTKNSDVTTPVVSFNDCSFTGNYTNEKQKGLPLVDSNSEVSFNNFTGKWGFFNSNV